MIERMRLRNFRRYRDATIGLKPGVNFIEGLNNAGKTSLLYAIEYAFFGRVENFKTIRALVQPGKRSLGVELVFAGRGGERYLLQRVHQAPAKSKKTMEGHFTLKAVSDDGETYLLASDFGDTEDKLALKLHELTGLTRRLFSIALHVRQGDIPAILEGSKQLDIVLGVTAASMAEEELRQMALELEKECGGLAVLSERLRSLGKELATAGEELTKLRAERQESAHKLAALGEVADQRADFEKKLAPVQEALAAHQKRHDEREIARRRLADEQERKEAALKAGALADLDRELLKLEGESAARAKTVKKLSAEIAEVETEQRKLDQQRGDLAGRIERRKGLPTGKGAKCEYCGAPIKAAQMAKETAEWTAELGQLDKAVAEFQGKCAKLRAGLEKENVDERKQLERTLHVKKQREWLTEIEANLAKWTKDHDTATAGEKNAYAAIEAATKTLAAQLKDDTMEAKLYFAGDPAASVAAIREMMQSLRHALAERVGKQMAERQALQDLLRRFEAQVQALERRLADLEKEQAGVQAQASALQLKAARAEKFRRLSAGFKELQVRIRTEAATKLAGGALDLYRRISEKDEFTSLTIDPAHYAVQVVPRDLGEEVPAGLYEGGGQRLLLGLAYRLAVGRLVGHSSLLMLDEPTYGLDAPHREALLERIGGQELARQILVVTHHARATNPGHRIQVERRERETVIAGA